MTLPISGTGFSFFYELYILHIPTKCTGGYSCKYYLHKEITRDMSVVTKSWYQNKLVYGDFFQVVLLICSKKHYKLVVLFKYNSLVPKDLWDLCIFHESKGKCKISSLDAHFMRTTHIYVYIYEYI